MFKNVLVGVDGRPNGRDAIALASHLTEVDGRLTLAHVYGGEIRASIAMTPGLVAEEEERSREMLEQQRSAADVKAELVSIASTSPGRGLHQQAEEQGADLLVVGSCAHGAFGRAMLGDNTRAALNGAPCAVAIASAGYADHPTPIAKVGVGYNGSPESKAALAVARKLAAATRALVYALEVVSIPTYTFTGLIPPITGESIDLMLREANARMKALGDVEGRAVYGLSGEELAAFGDDVDVLVVGSRGYGPMRRLVLGSTSDYLQRHARCSLLVLPRTASQAGESGTSSQLEAQAPTGAAV
jgi:nucleotide-binding universal stress UspA family protein